MVSWLKSNHLTAKICLNCCSPNPTSTKVSWAVRKASKGGVPEFSWNRPAFAIHLPRVRLPFDSRSGTLAREKTSPRASLTWGWSLRIPPRAAEDVSLGDLVFQKESSMTSCGRIEWENPYLWDTPCHYPPTTKHRTQPSVPCQEPPQSGSTLGVETTNKQH